VFPKRHVTQIFDLSRPETNAYNELMKETKRNIEMAEPSVSGFNVGVNNGRAAGQTVEHCHVHLIPRRVGDVEHPAGGIRKALPSRPSSGLTS
jgi:diadenosine tetraphosphate (Ap4A) HIT family hydrolase